MLNSGEECLIFPDLFGVAMREVLYIRKKSFRGTNNENCNHDKNNQCGE